MATYLVRRYKNSPGEAYDARFWQEMDDDQGILVETHEKFPVDTGIGKLSDTFMTITKRTVADRIASYLRPDISLEQLVRWSEDAMLDGDFDENDAAMISDAVARVGVGDVRAFNLTWRIVNNSCDSSATPPESTSWQLEPETPFDYRFHTLCPLTIDPHNTPRVCRDSGHSTIFASSRSRSLGTEDIRFSTFSISSPETGLISSIIFLPSLK